MSNLKDNRKRQLSEFRDLFAALFKIPDKDVQKRVIDAINGVCNQYDNQNLSKLRDSSTQTDHQHISIGMETKIKSDYTKYLSLDEHQDISKDDDQKPSTKKRRRNKKVPKVEKHDTSQHDKDFKTFEMPMLKEEKKKKVDKDDISKLLDFFSPSEIEDAELGLLESKTYLTKDDVIKQMIKEYEISEIYSGEYYPIHHAIMDNDINRLKRQIYVFDKKQKNINELLTKNDETPIQLAIKWDCYYEIIEILLEKEIDIEQIDKNGNTLIHLTVRYTDNIKILKKLLNKVELNFILKYNYEGLNALHIAVIWNKFNLCKALIDYINLKLNINSIGLNVDDEKILEDIFIKELTKMSFNRAVNIKWNDKKYKIINQRDQKHGRTALFFALGNNTKKLIIFLLLINLADPNIEDRSGTDCFAYAKEIIERTTDTQIFTSLEYASVYIDSNSSNISKYD